MWRRHAFRSPPLYAADRADRLLRRGLAAGEARKKRHRNDDQPMQHAPARPNSIGPILTQCERAPNARRMLLRRRGVRISAGLARRSPAATERTSMACKYFRPLRLKVSPQFAPLSLWARVHLRAAIVTIWGTGGRGFKSRRPDQINQSLRRKPLSTKSTMESIGKAKNSKK